MIQADGEARVIPCKRVTCLGRGHVPHPHHDRASWALGANVTETQPSRVSYSSLVVTLAEATYGADS